MILSADDRAMLAGEMGPAIQRGMEIIVTLGRIYGADRLVSVGSVQVAGVSYRNLGEAGLEFLREWAAQGARVRVPTTLNPAGMDLRAWREMGIPEPFARKQHETVDVYTSMGIQPTCTCTPYLVGNVPSLGESVAWSESSAVVYANSVLGARTNREGGPSALAAAITGRTAAYGLHTDKARRATHRIRVTCRVKAPWEYAALGYHVGALVGQGIPFFEGLRLPAVSDSMDAKDDNGQRSLDCLKALGAALAASGAVALYHVAGVTPEARMRDDLCAEHVPIATVDTLGPAIEALNGPVDRVDLVVLGCPHASLRELAQVAGGLRGKLIQSDLWVTVSRGVREQAERLGWVNDIEAAGGKVVADGCVVVAPMQELCYKALATNSAKMATYAPSHAGLQVRFGSLEACLRAALSGRWEPN